ncbi:hypothetical protein AGENTSMITH_152 [Bacillus phage vB_BspM_AgentSmith]|nr:hypothetical protein AGENTSMITH_152 [Bacillus phage vB_BspM_AgentSmith]
MKAKWWVRLWTYLVGLRYKVVMESSKVLEVVYLDDNGKKQCEVEYDCTKTIKDKESLFFTYDSDGGIISIRRIGKEEVVDRVLRIQTPTKVKVSNSLGVTENIEARLEVVTTKHWYTILGLFRVNLPIETTKIVELWVEGKPVFLRGYSSSKSNKGSINLTIREYCMEHGFTSIVNSNEEGTHNQLETVTPPKSYSIPWPPILPNESLEMQAARKAAQG